MKRIYLIILSVFLVQAVFSQEEKEAIDTDRPTFSESPLTVPKNTFQIESGVQFGWDKQDGVSSKDLGFNSNLFRYGINRRFEVRLGVNFAGYQELIDETDEKTTLSGLTPIVVGFKWNILYGDGPIPTLAISSHVDIPGAASNDFNDGNVLQTLRFAGSWKLSKVFNFGFNLGSLIDWKEYDFTGLYSVALTASIVKWLGAFMEFYSISPPGEYSRNNLNMGLMFPVRNNLQFDLSGGIGLSNSAPDNFVNIGFAWRIPN